MKQKVFVQGREKEPNFIRRGWQPLEQEEGNVEEIGTTPASSEKIGNGFRVIRHKGDEEYIKKNLKC